IAGFLLATPLSILTIPLSLGFFGAGTTYALKEGLTQALQDIRNSDSTAGKVSSGQEGLSNKEPIEILCSHVKLAFKKEFIGLKTSEPIQDKPASESGDKETTVELEQMDNLDDEFEEDIHATVDNKIAAYEEESKETPVELEQMDNLDDLLKRFEEDIH